MGTRVAIPVVASTGHGTFIFLALFLSLAPVLAIEDGRIGVIYICHPVHTPGFDFMLTEPVFSMTFVAATYGWGGWDMYDIQRAIRLYMPRTYQELVTKNDVIMLDNANRGNIPTKHLEFLARAVEEGEVGLLMGGGWESFGGSGSSHPPWGETSLGELLPTEDVVGTWAESGRLVILDWDHEYVSSIPWNRRGAFMEKWHHNKVTLKPGARLLANVDSNTLPFPGETHPMFVTWELPQGARVFAMTGNLVFIGGVSPIPWEYYGDAFSNMAIYLDKRPVPQDVELVHSVRTMSFQIKTRGSMLLSLLEFTESFGANTRGIMEELDSVNEMMSGVREAYIDLRFDEVLEVYRDVEEILKSLEERAIELKQRALFWVYVIEWLSVSGTGLLAGFVLWSVMIRRRLYREVGGTRFV
jgi:uncharacterized membrane protein